MKLLRLLVWVPLLAACSSSPSALFKRLKPNQTGIDFVNKLEETETDNVLNYEYFYNGGGVAAADFNNDGRIDLYFTANQGEDKLYLNEGALKFKDVTKAAGITWQGEWKTGVTVVDLNGDGWQDIYVSVSGNVTKPQLRRNKLYVNNQNGTFTDRAAEYGLDFGGYTTNAAFFDYDNDGDLDCYLLNHNIRDFNRFDVESVRAMRDSLAGHRLLRNDGPRFVDVSAQAGIKGNPIGFGLGIHTADLNGDGYTDLYVSNDYIEEDYLYLNNGNGTFTDVIKQATGHVSYFSMGNDAGDVNNDLRPDVVTMDMLPEDNKRQKLLFGPDKYEAYLSMLRNGFHPETMRNMLQLNMGTEQGAGSGGQKAKGKTAFDPLLPAPRPLPHFSEIGQLAGISNTDWSWSPLLADFDNDGFNDLFVTNGYVRDYTDNDFIKYKADMGGQTKASVLELINHMPSTRTANYIFRNERNLTFSNQRKTWGFDEPVLSNGAAYADLDSDGDLEIITNNVNEPAFVYQNLSAERGGSHYLDLALQPKRGLSATGTKVYAYADSLRQYREYTPTHGFQSSMAVPLHFGLGGRTGLDSLVVVWRDGSRQKLTAVKADQRLAVSYAPNGGKTADPEAAEPLFSPTDALNFTHQQQPFNDFSRQGLLPHMLSYAGPRIAQGDVNGDGLTDLYVGGGKGQAGGLFFWEKSGQLLQKNTPAFEADKLCTDTDAAFLDADGDGDLDLYVTSGGYEYLPTDLLLQSRLYLNDGKGGFTKDLTRLDNDDYGGNCVKTLDFDRDGDLDVFVGGSVVPGRYPEARPSRLYRNDRAKFVPVANAAFENLGLVTDACTVDFDRDGDDDLVAVGEWTPVVRLRNERGTFTRLPDEPDAPTGLWQRVLAGDFDRDGDADLIVGNYGLNSQFKASVALPILLHNADFDGNGTPDPILSYAIGGETYPAYSRDELLDQLPPLRKKYTTYALYSEATTDDVLKKFPGKTPTVFRVNTLETAYLVNEGGRFQRRALPIEAQFAPVCALASGDLNDDGFPDLILAGNQSRGRVRTGNIDACYGQVLLNDHRGGFVPLPQAQSGLWLRGDVRSLLLLGNRLVVGTNSQPVRVYEKKAAELRKPVPLP